MLIMQLKSKFINTYFVFFLIIAFIFDIDIFYSYIYSIDDYSIYNNYLRKSKVCRYYSDEFPVITTIPVAYSTNHKYIYPTLVSMTSLLLNKNINTFYKIYIMITEGSNEDDYSVLKNVEKQYTNCTVDFIQVDKKRFRGFTYFTRLAIQTYYRLLLPDFLPQYDKLIYLDGDTIVFQDLTEMFNLDIEGKLFLGEQNANIAKLEKLPELKSKIDYINAGVLLVNLKMHREEGLAYEMMSWAHKNHRYLSMFDQTIINYFSLNRTGLLPPKFGIYAASYDVQRRKLKSFTREEIKEASDYPGIMHYVWIKPWEHLWLKREREYWWSYARASGHFDEISQFYKKSH